MPKQITVELHCTCGMSMTLTFRPDTSPDKVQQAARAAFNIDHSGAGHALCDAGTAARKRATWQRRMFDEQ